MTNLGKFDNLHKDKRGFVIGGGQSLKTFNSDLSSEVTIGINKAYKILTPTYLYWSDTYFWTNFQGEVRKVNSIKLCPDNIQNVDLDVNVITRKSNSDLNSLPKSFTNPISMWNNSGTVGLRLAYLFGLNPIYLVGFDLNLLDKSGDTHFHKDYDKSRTKKLGDNRYKDFFTSFKFTIKSLKEKGVEVFSCTKDSRLNTVITYVDIESVLI